MGGVCENHLGLVAGSITEVSVNSALPGHYTHTPALSKHCNLPWLLPGVILVDLGLVIPHI